MINAILSTVVGVIGAGSILGGLKAIDWLLTKRYQTVSHCSSCREELSKNCAKCQQEIKDKMVENRQEVAEKIEKQYKDILDKIEHQIEIFQNLATSVAEISAENKIILKQLNLK